MTTQTKAQVERSAVTALLGVLDLLVWGVAASQIIGLVAVVGGCHV
jgi:hypothetical protein